jgi:DNA-binding LytR/AlgR family response regulator
MLKKILIIEDEKQLLNNISILLNSEGYTVITSYNGFEGIKLAKEHTPDLIICDIMMPGIDGYEVLRELSNDKNTSSIPFIFLTAKVERNDLRKGMNLGADDYIFKPFKSDELIKAIQTRLNKLEVRKAVIQNEHSNSEDLTIVRYKLDDNIFFKMPNSSLLVTVDKIKYIVSDSQYTFVFLEDNKQILIRRSISKWEKMLPEKIFIRIHRSTIINSHFIKEIEKIDSNVYKISLKNTVKSFDISRKYLKKLKEKN